MSLALTYLKKEVDHGSTLKPNYWEYQSAVSSTAKSITTQELVKGEKLPMGAALQVLNNLGSQFSDHKALFVQLAQVKTVQEVSLDSFSSEQLEGIEKLESVIKLILRPKNRHAIGYTIPQEITKMKALTEVVFEEYLFGRGNGRQNMSTILSIPQLKSLTFSNCHLGVFSSAIEKHSTLENISFFGEQISEATIKALQSCSKVKKIEFTNCNFLFTCTESTLKKTFGESVDVTVRIKEGSGLSMQMTTKPSPFSIKS